MNNEQGAFNDNIMTLNIISEFEIMYLYWNIAILVSCYNKINSLAVT